MGSAPTGSPSTRPGPTTFAPTRSPVFNKFFCAKDYQLAEENCWSAEPCPTGICTDPSEQCFGISAEKCLSQEPTMSPTTAPPTGSPVPNPTSSPVVNTYFCGNTYVEANESCSEATACPSLTCPDGLTCFAGIECPVSDAGLPLSDLTQSTTTSTTPQLTWAQLISPPQSNTQQGEPAPGASSAAVPASSQQLLGLPAQLSKNDKYCGMSFDDATEHCATADPCPENVGCGPGQGCFTLPEGCSSLDSDGGSASELGEPAPGASSAAIPSSSGSDPASKQNNSQQAHHNHYTSFCGNDYNDAVNNCFNNDPCPSMYSEECPSGQKCFPIGGICEIASSISANVGDIWESTLSKPTPRPTWNIDFVIMKENGTTGLRGMSMVKKSLALIVVILAAL